MKTKILIAASLAALIVPAASFGSGPTGQDRENGARACRALRTSLGEDLFRQSYGTVQSQRRNAMGRCVSMWTHAAHQARISARAACSAEQADEAAAFEPHEDASDPADAFCEAPAGLVHERWGEERIGVHDQNGVIVAELGKEEVEDLVQGPRPLVLVADRHEDVCAR